MLKDVKKIEQAAKEAMKKNQQKVEVPPAEEIIISAPEKLERLNWQELPVGGVAPNVVATDQTVQVVKNSDIVGVNTFFTNDQPSYPNPQLIDKAQFNRNDLIRESERGKGVIPPIIDLSDQKQMILWQIETEEKRYLIEAETPTYALVKFARSFESGAQNEVSITPFNGELSGKIIIIS